MKFINKTFILFTIILICNMLASCKNSNGTGIMKAESASIIEASDNLTQGMQPAESPSDPVASSTSATSSDVLPADIETNKTADTPEANVVTPVTITFAGDVLIDSGVKSAYINNGFDGIFSEDGNTMKLSDIFMINLEFPFSTRGTTAPDKEWTFRGDPEHIQFLTDLGVDIVSLANNHSLDYGESAFLDTLDLLDANDIHYVGGGVNLQEASNFEILEVNGVKIAFLAASRVLPAVDWYATEAKPGLFSTYDPGAVLKKITEADMAADYVVVYVHWGVEKAFIPEEWQREMAKQYIDAGASCVIGSHPHVLQGIEYYMGKPIIYSLGNFVFTDWDKDTMTATVTFDENISVSLKPYMIKNLKTIPAADAEDMDRILKHLRDVSFNAFIDDDFLVYPLE